MILFLSSWHILIVIGVFLGASAFLGVSGILSLLWGVWKQLEKENDGWEQAKRERRSAAAKKGHVTRKARVGERVPMSDEEIEVRERLRERIGRSLEAEDRADAITPDDALGFIRGEDQ